MRKTFLLMATSLLMLWGCGDGAKQRSEEAETDESTFEQQAETHGTKIETMELTTPLDPAMVHQGEEIYDLKCSSCHRLSDERLVGPGWKNVTERREPTWIMNIITNVDMMLAEDAEAQKCSSNAWCGCPTRTFLSRRRVVSWNLCERMTACNKLDTTLLSFPKI